MKKKSNDWKSIPFVITLDKVTETQLQIFAAQVARDVLNIVSADQQNNGPDILDRLWKVRILDIWRERCEKTRQGYEKEK